VSATPTIQGDIVYYPTWSGLLVALNYKTCVVAWQINVTSLVTEYALLTAVQASSITPVSRTSPQLEEDIVYFATLTHALLFAAAIDPRINSNQLPSFGNPRDEPNRVSRKDLHRLGKPRGISRQHRTLDTSAAPS